MLFPMVCLICKTPWPRGGRIPCDYCLSGLLALREPYTRVESAYSIHSLFAWRRESPPGLAWLVRSLKRQTEILPWRELAACLVENFAPPANAVLVPIPSLGPNHALGLARALGHWSGLPVAEALAASVKTRSQKRRSRIDRQSITFERADWAFCSKFRTVVIVDDIVTTGSTVRAGYHTLGRPEKCEVWCLLDRRPCGT